MEAPDNVFGVAYVIKGIAEDIRAIRNDMSSFALKTETAYLTAKIEDFVPRQEFAARMKHDDERYEQMTEIVKEIRSFLGQTATKDDFKSLKAEFREEFKDGPIAPWIWPATSLFIALVALLYSIYRPGAH